MDIQTNAHFPPPDPSIEMHLTSLCRLFRSSLHLKGAANCNATASKFNRERHLASPMGKTVISYPDRSLEVTKVAVDPFDIWSGDNVEENNASDE